MGLFKCVLLFLSIISAVLCQIQLNKSLLTLLDPDIASFVKDVNGKDAAIFRAFKDFEIDILPSQVKNLSILYGTENADTSKYENLTCDTQCFLIFRINNNQKIHCSFGGQGFSKCQCPRDKEIYVDYGTDHAPNGYQISKRNLGFILKQCEAFDFSVNEKDSNDVIRASVKCVDIRWNYTYANPPDKCIFGLYSTVSKHPFFNVTLSKAELLKTDSTKTLLYDLKDAKKVPNSNVTFIKEGWPKIQIHPKSKNTRFTFIKPGKIRNFPGFIFEYDNMKCNNVKFVLKFFDNDTCQLYFHTTTDFVTISPTKYDDKTHFYLRTNLTNWIMYYNSPNIRFSDKSFTELFNSTDFFLCNHTVDERFVIEIIEYDFLSGCTGMGMVTGPEVMVEVDAPEEIPGNSTNSDNITETLPPSNKSTTESSKINEASIFPWIFGGLTLLALIIISVINFFLIRRKWFKQSRATLKIEAFEKHWQYIIPETLNNNNNNNDNDEKDE